MTALADAIRLLSHLGGPECTEENVAWAADIPSGKRLFEWLASQMHAVDGGLSHPATSVAGRSKGNLGAQDVALQTVLSSVSLYEDETSIFSALPHHAHLESSESSGSLAYELPSTLRSRAATLDYEAELLEARATRLKRRRESVRSETKRLKEAVSVSRREANAANETAQEQQRRLADLSVQADNAAARCTEKASGLLEDASRQDKSHISTLRSELAHLERGRLAVIDTVGRLHQLLDDAYDALPEGTDIQAQATALDSRFRKLRADSASASSLAAASYEDELGRMVSAIEQLSPNDTESLERLIHSELQSGSNDAAKSTPALPPVPDVKVEIERAGLIDRISLLANQEDGLDRASNDLRDKLLPRLRRCYDVLQSRNASAVEAEVVVSALIEELEDINDVIKGLRRTGEGESAQERHPEDPDRLLQAAVMDLLKRLLRSRSDRPIVLLDRSDVEAELASLADRLASAHNSEAEWASELVNHLRELSRSRATLLDVTHKNSPMNTSAPYAPSHEEAALRDNAQSYGEMLRKEASRLQKKSEFSSRDKRKLTDFVNKWCST